MTVSAPAASARRVHITGAPGSGKTTLAARWAAATGLPVHHTDDLARVGGGTGPVRPPAERDPLVARIVASDAWITEGVHLGWTEPLLARADLIVRLDTVGAGAASGRIARRFARDAWRSWRARTWGERARAVPGSIRRAWDLGVAVVGARRYATAGPTAPGDHDTLGSRAATDRALAAHADRVLVCRSLLDVDALVASLDWSSMGQALDAPVVAARRGVSHP